MFTTQNSTTHLPLAVSAEWGVGLIVRAIDGVSRCRWGRSGWSLSGRWVYTACACASVEIFVAQAGVVNRLARIRRQYILSLATLDRACISVW